MKMPKMPKMSKMSMYEILLFVTLCASAMLMLFVNFLIFAPITLSLIIADVYFFVAKRKFPAIFRNKDGVIVEENKNA